MTKHQWYVSMVMFFVIFAVTTSIMGAIVGSVVGSLLVGAFMAYGAGQPGGSGWK